MPVPRRNRNDRSGSSTAVIGARALGLLHLSQPTLAVRIGTALRPSRSTDHAITMSNLALGGISAERIEGRVLVAALGA
jgi:hypothetical protein